MRRNATTRKRKREFSFPWGPSVTVRGLSRCLRERPRAPGLSRARWREARQAEKAGSSAVVGSVPNPGYAVASASRIVPRGRSV